MLLVKPDRRVASYEVHSRSVAEFADLEILSLTARDIMLTVKGAWRRSPRPAAAPQCVSHPIQHIVQYQDGAAARNDYPARIVSPVRPGPCCATGMTDIGTPQEEGRWVFQYRRCRTCGFTVRKILREIPDAAQLAELRVLLERTFIRGE